MHQKGELEGAAAYIFRETRDVEELYDLEKDPNEINNLAGNPTYREQLLKMRKQLSDWQLKVNDKGLIDEYNLVQLFWPGLVQPSTDKVSLSVENDAVRLSCPTEGASIGYQIDDQIGKDRWLVYQDPVKVKKGQKIVVRAKRIGYKISQQVEFMF